MNETTERPTPFEHVLVATDFSPSAGRAVERAARLPFAGRTRYSIVHVLADVLPRALLADAESYARLRLERARSALSAQLVASGGAGVEVSTELCRGVASEEIVRHATGMGADLILLGRHGKEPVHALFLGSTAERVARRAEQPVLLVNLQPLQPYRRPLLGVALGRGDHELVRAMCRVLPPGSAAATMVHAHHAPLAGLLSSASMAEVRDEYRQLAAAGMATLQNSVAQLGVRWQTILDRGDAADVIVAEAMRRGTDLIVVGTRARTPLEDGWRARLSERVVRSASADVLVVRVDDP